MSRFQEVLNSNDLVRRAYDFAQKAHRGQKRKNGEPYFNHALAAAEFVAEWKLDETTIAAALLHDVVEDTGCPLTEIQKSFGEEVAFLVDGVTKISKVRYRGVEAKVENLRKFILYLSQDIRVILIKLADRLHNMKTLSALPPQKQKRIALETTDIYAPLAYRLGMQKLSGELEDLAFPFIYPQEHRWLIQNVKEKYEERERYIEKVKPVAAEALQKAGVGIIKVDSRAKRYASLYKKLLRHDMDIEKIYDLVALRIIVQTIDDCYAALGVIHGLWPPLPNRIKDYIALPKPNRYRSIHTTVFCLDQKITEVQIRTGEMHEEAETGIAAHWAYQQTKQNAAGDFAVGEFQLVTQLRNWQKENLDAEEFMDSLKIDFFKDRIFAITPKGEVMDLPVGATPVDFAYQIHTEIGDSCVGAKINGKIAPLDQPLRSGDVVDILTQKNKKPSEDWLNFVQTGTARNHIRAALKTRTAGLVKKEPQVAELKIVAEDKVGLLKDITSVISRSHVNILAINSVVNTRFPTIKIRCGVNQREKIEKLILKLKQLKEIKEVGYQLV